MPADFDPVGQLNIDSWQETFDNSDEYTRLTKRFKEFRTVDWVREAYEENREYYRELLRSKQGSSEEEEGMYRDSEDQTTIEERSESELGTASSSSSSNSRVLRSLGNLNRIQMIKSRLWITFQEWLALTLIGTIIGSIAGSLNIVSEWLGDLKAGYCSNGFYLNKDFCCWGEAEEQCSNWVPWSSFGVGRYLIYIVLSVLFGTTAAMLCRYYAPTAAGSGISEVKCIVSGFVVDGFLGWWTLLIKSIGLPLVIASGLSVGKEGPSVHYAACTGNVIAKLFTNFKNSYMHQSQFLTAASAAGVAVAFAAPIGGVLFSIEEISSNFKLSTVWKSYYCALVATGTLSAMNTFRTGQLVIFQVTYDTAWKYFEIPFYIILGIFGGIYGIVISKFNIKCVSFRNKYLKDHPVKEVALLCLFTASVGYFSEFIRLDMTEGMEILFHECREKSNEIGSVFENEICQAATSKGRLIRTVISLLYATLLRMVLVVISYNSKIPCGIFVPSMAVGATFGKALGLIAEAIFNDPSKCSSGDGNNCVISGTYAFLGAGAALCGITNLTLAVVIIMFELTGALKYVIPTMIVVAVTKIIGDRFGIGMGGISDQMVRFNGIPFLDAKEKHDFGSTKLSDAMMKEVVALPYTGLKFGELEQLLKETSFSVLPVIDSAKNAAVLGVADKNALLHACIEARGSDIIDLSDKNIRLLSDSKVIEICGTDEFVDSLSLGDELNFEQFLLPEVISVNTQTSLYSVLDIFIKLGPRAIVVEDKGRLCGLITRKDLAKFELYLQYTKHGNAFLSLHDDVVFEKIWNIMEDIGTKWNELVEMVWKRRSVMPEATELTEHNS
ncbi:DEKNAAC103374 [Brettanomyces naardenensis]|uniref:Chloride channel protein n=1 Tax=Brettanomyces naardenensis TaxID=13370 RepID=A0A448YNW6_BRENA|nr:DEKNAAC103374 [Brettanomyces naardenensis]